MHSLGSYFLLCTPLYDHLGNKALKQESKSFLDITIKLGIHCIRCIHRNNKHLLRPEISQFMSYPNNPGAHRHRLRSESRSVEVE